MIDEIRTRRQLLLNLLSNASKFTAGGQIDLSVTPGAKPDWWRFEVADNGRGISAEDQAHLFEPFWRAASPDGEAGETPSSGSGLGLAVAHHIVEAMDGRMEVHSVVSQGSRFVVEPPLSPGLPAQVLLPSEGFGHADGLSAGLPAGLLALVIDAPLSHADRVVELLFAVDADVQRLDASAALPAAELLLCDPALLDAPGLTRLRMWRHAVPERRCIALLDRPMAAAVADLFDAELFKPLGATALLAGLSCLPGRAVLDGAEDPGMEHQQGRPQIST